MAAIPKPMSTRGVRAPESSFAVNAIFLKDYLRPVRTHAAVQFRDLAQVDREEAISEATAAAFLNVRSAVRNGKAHRLTPATVANYAVLHVRGGNHVGGSLESKRDVMSFRAQQAGGFKVESLPWDSASSYNILKVPDQRVWRLRLLEDRRTHVADQVRFRIDWSSFMAKQHDRTRTAMAMLADGHKQTEVADHLAITPSAVCQRMSRARREWMVFQGTDDEETSAPNQQA